MNFCSYCGCGISGVFCKHCAEIIDAIHAAIDDLEKIYSHSTEGSTAMRRAGRIKATLEKELKKINDAHYDRSFC